MSFFFSLKFKGKLTQLADSLQWNSWNQCELNLEFDLVQKVRKVLRNEIKLVLVFFMIRFERNEPATYLNKPLDPIDFKARKILTRVRFDRIEPKFFDEFFPHFRFALVRFTLNSEFPCNAIHNNLIFYFKKYTKKRK